jgi:glycerol-3-phosphate acyltransferase PlsY
MILEFIHILLCTTGAYLIGSIPTSILISKFFYGIAIRDHGDGTSSYENVRLILGWEAALASGVLNGLKGFLGAGLVYFVHRQYGLFNSDAFPVLEMAFGVAVVLGHILPLFARFEGGKGIHCSIGVLFAVSPLVTLAFGAVAALIFLLFRYPSLAWAAASLALPLMIGSNQAQYLKTDLYEPMMAFSIALALLMLFTHRQSLRHILRGEAQKISLTR